jgi:hypothetical protein
MEMVSVSPAGSRLTFTKVHSLTGGRSVRQLAGKRESRIARAQDEYRGFSVHRVANRGASNFHHTDVLWKRTDLVVLQFRNLGGSAT